MKAPRPNIRKAKHYHGTPTPGPWKVVGGGGPTRPQIIKADIGTLVAETYCDNLLMDDLVLEPMANACILAAGPELLKSLKAVSKVARLISSTKHAGNPIGPTLWSDLHQDLNEAEEVIAKAEGG